MARGFDRPLCIRARTATREQAVARIAGRYREFVDIFDKHASRPSRVTA